MSVPKNPPPNIIPAGEKIVNHFRKASAVYYIESRRIMVAAESFSDARKAIRGLEIKVRAEKIVTD